MTHTVFVTGADGFIGSALCAQLETAGYRVMRGVQPSDDASPSIGNSARIIDIGPSTDWGGVLEDVDAIIHLAARVHVLHETETDPLAAYRRVNTAGTERLARAATQQGVKRLVFISTIGVHGSSTAPDEPFSELTPIAPHSPYAQSKWEAEEALRRIEQETGLEVVIVRPPLVYGPSVPGNFVRLLKWVYRGIPLPLSAVNNQRSFIALDNLVDFLRTCVEHPDAAGQVFLISDTETVSTPELIQRFAQALDCPAHLFPCPLPVLRLLGSVSGRRQSIDQLIGSLTVDSSKARQRLNWQPVILMDNQLAQTAQWFKSRGQT